VEFLLGSGTRACFLLLLQSGTTDGGSRGYLGDPSIADAHSKTFILNLSLKLTLLHLKKLLSSVGSA
jgi:hypothetical protein